MAAVLADHGGRLPYGYRAQLAATLGVTPETIRRDLIHLRGGSR